MARKAFIPIPVSGPLETSDPSTSLPAGALLKAVDLNTRSWGSRPAGKLMTWVGRIPTAGVTNIGIGLCPGFAFDGSATLATALVQTEQATLGSSWTCDVAFHAYASRATANAVPVFAWQASGTSVVEVGFYGTLHATPNKLYAIVRTYNVGSAATTVYTLVGGTCPFSAQTTLVASNAVTRAAVRVIRSGSTLKLLDSTGTTAVTTSVTAEDVHTAATAWKLASAAVGASFNGVFFHAILRDYAAPLTVTPPMTQHTFPKSKGVRLFLDGTNELGAGGNLYVTDHSSYGSHGLITSPTATGLTLADRHYPISKPVQGFGSFVDVAGNIWSGVMVGGTLAWQVVR